MRSSHVYERPLPHRSSDLSVAVPSMVDKGMTGSCLCGKVSYSVSGGPQRDGDKVRR